MRKATRLVIDSGCFYFGGLEQTVEFGIPASMFRTLFNICSSLDCYDFCVCWDSNKSKRKEIFPEYKSNRKQSSKIDPDDYKRYVMDAQYVRKHLFPRVGFKNNYFASGYEADDHIAAVVQNFNFHPKDHIMIVSADQDMYQLLSDQVSVYSPLKREIVTFNGFYKKYNIHPVHWASVKAIGGCKSDGIYGIKKVGEKTAIKLINEGEFGNIFKEYYDLISRNLKLVDLPFEGTPIPEGWVPTSFNEKSFKEVILLENMKFFETSYGKGCYLNFVYGLNQFKMKNRVKFNKRKDHD